MATTLKPRITRLEQSAPTTSIAGASDSALAHVVSIPPGDMTDFARFMRCDSTLDQVKEAQFEAHLQKLAGTA